MDPYTRALMMAAPGMVKSIGGLFSKPPQQKVGNDTTQYLNKLRNVSKEGLYGQDVKNEVSTDIAQRSDDTQNAIRASAIKQGIENSGVVAQQLIKEGGKSTLTAARMAKEIAKANEESKLNASKMASEVGQSIEDIYYNNALARFNQRKEAKDSFWDAVGTGTEGYIAGMDKKAYSNIVNDKDFLQWLLTR
tara:strand:- start:2710 stop:3285 length:576 start_codon:yes stop_codon:yes gene_type:complete